MKQLICINVGSAGVNMGSKLWENYTKEHEINYEGQQINQQTIYNHHSIFSQTSLGRYVPRNIFIDNDRDTIDELNKGPKRQLYHQNYSISGKEDASNNYMRGNRISCNIIQDVQDKVRKLMQNCNYLEGIIVNFALSGGTGSSLTNLLLSRLQASGAVKKKTVVLNALISSPHISDTIVEPYNMVMGLGQIVDIHNNQSIIIAYDNEQLYKYSEHQDIDGAGYNEINQYIAKATAILTNNIRTKICDFSLSQITTNTVPYPRTNILTPSLSFSQIQIKEDKIIDSLYSKSTRLNSYSITNQKIMGYFGFFRGSINKFQLFKKIQYHKNNQSVVSCCSNQIKLTISQQQLKKSSNQNQFQGLILRNSTGILKFFDTIHSKYQRLYQKRAFVHWYVGEGIADQSFDYPRNVTMALQRDYQQMCSQDIQQQEQSSEV